MLSPTFCSVLVSAIPAVAVTAATDIMAAIIAKSGDRFMLMRFIGFPPL
jgi:hypothetical protein